MMPQPSAPSPTAGPGQNALAYAALGWRVLPIKPGEKRPPMTGWQKAASTDPDTVRSWFKDLYRNYGVGIATGEASGIWVLDIDVGPDKPGAESLAALEAEHGPLPATVEAVTGSGGRHLYYRWPEGRRVITRRDTGKTASPLPAGIDVRGDGGQVLAPPTIHPSGTVYRWREERSPWEIQVADAPAWLLEVVCEQEATPVVETPTTAPAPVSGSTLLNGAGDYPTDDSIAEWHEKRTDWSGLLLNSGWTPARMQGDQQYWVRPGKQVHDGHSAVLHLPDGPFVIFSTDGSLARFAQPWATTATGDGWAFNKFGFLAADKHGGDKSETARQLRRTRIAYEQTGAYLDYAPATNGTDTQATTDSILLDWEKFWSKDHSTEEWLAYPVVPAQRQVAMYAPGGEGKSLLTLAIAAALALGRTCLGQTPGPPIDVLYVDYEMTESDLMDRLSDLGYDAEDDWTHLHYALLPSIEPLDTKAGAQQICELAEAVDAKLVVIDTMARAVGGDENEADTYRDFYGWTGRRLKAAGRALLRLDHAGKEADRGQRGSSAKNDDVDVVWRMARADNGFTLTARKARMGWIPATVAIVKVEGPPLEFVVQSKAFMWPAGTKEIVDLLDELEVPVGCSTRDAQAALKTAFGKGRVRKLVVAAVKYRNGTEKGLLSDVVTASDGLVGHVTPVTKVVPVDLGTTSSAVPSEPLSEPLSEGASEQDGNQSGTTGNHLHSQSGNQWWSPEGNHLVPKTGSEPEDEGLFS